MGWFGSWFGGGGSSGTPSFPTLSNATTADLIRDRIIDVIEALTPKVLSANRFLRYRNEDPADFIAWAEANPTAALRRFQVRDTGDDNPPPVSNTDYEEREVTFSIIVAYPQGGRMGKKDALDRDTAMSKDQHDIEHAIGLCGRQNFVSPNPDAVWRSGKTSRVKGNASDFLVIEQTMAFLRKQFG